jgi:Protein of unknown function (DUF2797)
VEAAESESARLLCRGISWSDRRPSLDLVDVDVATPRRVPLLGQRIGLRVISPGPYCLGFSGNVDGVLTGVACPRDAYATSGQQCDECLAKDEFRFAHHAHLGGYVPDALASYLARPHWVYIATFADATSKVGTASAGREFSRLDEQGAVVASYVAHPADGRVARVYEDAVTERAGIPQTKRRAAKVVALERPRSAAAVEAEHTDAVGQARDVLRSAPERSDVAMPTETWERPPAMAAFFANVPIGGWLPYPHQLAVGEHGFEIDAVAGSVVLTRLRPDPDAVRYVVDLGALVGHRISLGPYESPNTPVQLGLFE